MEPIYNRWTQGRLVIDEVDWDGSLHAYEVYYGGDLVTTIVPQDSAQSLEICMALAAGESVMDMEDGHGDSISTILALMEAQ